MPVTLNKPALRDFYTRVTQDPATKVGDKELDTLVAIVGDKKGFGGFFGITSDQLAKQLSTNPHFTRQDKFDLAKSGLDANEKSDLTALIRDPAFAQKLDASVMNFIGALIGLETLKPAETAVVVDRSRPEVQAADKMRELVKTGKLRDYYDALVGAKDDPALKAEAEKLFAALPVVKPGMTATEFVQAGLWTKAPQGIEQMQKSARYLPGRQVLVETTVKSKVPSRSDANYETQRRQIGEFDPNGVEAVTYRATLVGQDPAKPGNFLVKVDGADKPVSIKKEIIYKHNHPHTVAPRHIRSATQRNLPYNGTTWFIDYESPMAKAKLAEMAIKMDEAVGQIDFTKKGAVEHQKKAVEVIFRSIDMEYRYEHQGSPGGGRASPGERDAARQAIKGSGMCVQQSSVFGAMLFPFQDVLGVDGQYRSGNCFRNIRGATNNVFAPDYETGHGWWQVTFRPTMEMTVTDRTWNQVNYTLDRAYGFPYGDRYADRDIHGYERQELKPTDVDVTGNVTVDTVERQFSQVGDGRENHISNRRDP